LSNGLAVGTAGLLGLAFGKACASAPCGLGSTGGCLGSYSET